MLKKTFAVQVLSQVRAIEWFNRFEGGHEFRKDDKHSADSEYAQSFPRRKNIEYASRYIVDPSANIVCSLLWLLEQL